MKNSLQYRLLDLFARAVAERFCENLGGNSPQLREMPPKRSRSEDRRDLIRAKVSVISAQPTLARRRLQVIDVQKTVIRLRRDLIHAKVTLIAIRRKVNTRRLGARTRVQRCDTLFRDVTRLEAQRIAMMGQDCARMDVRLGWYVFRNQRS